MNSQMNSQPTTPETPTQIPPAQPETTSEQYRLTGNEIIEKAKQIVHEGNVRRVLIKNAGGQTIVEFPLTLGVIGTALAPMWAAVGTIVALVTNCTIEVEKRA